MRLSEITIGDSDKMIKDNNFDIFALLNISGKGRVLGFVEDRRFLDQLINPDLSCLICAPENVDVVRQYHPNSGIIVSNNPRVLFWRLFEKYDENRYKNSSTVIGAECKISPNAFISPNGVVIGNNVTIEEFVSIKEGVTIGNNCYVRTGAVIGTIGLEIIRTQEGLHLIDHHGGVVIGDDVIINDQTVIERSVFGWDSTIVGDGTIIDTRTIIAHCCKIGSQCMIGADAIISGSSVIGNNVRIGPGVITSHQVGVGDGSEIIMGTILRRDMKKNEVAVNNAVMCRLKFETLQNNQRQNRTKSHAG